MRLIKTILIGIGVLVLVYFVFVMFFITPS